jgi:hypothetical protein
MGRAKPAPQHELEVTREYEPDDDRLKQLLRLLLDDVPPAEEAS